MFGWNDGTALPPPKSRGPSQRVAPAEEPSWSWPEAHRPSVGHVKALENLSKRAPLVGFVPKRAGKRGSSARFSLQQKYDMNLQKFAVDRPKCRLHQESVNWQRTLIHLIRKNRVWNTDWLVRRDVPPLAIRNPWFFLTTWMFHAFSPHFQVPNGTKPFSGFPYTLVIQHNYVEDLNHRSISMRNVHESSMAKCDSNYQRLDSHQAPFKIHEIVLNPQFSMVS